MSFAPVRLLWVLLLMLIATPGSWAAQGAAVPFTTVAAGRTSSVQEATRVVIRDEAAWAALWSRHLSPRSGPLPAVDFRRDMVVAVFAGRSSGARMLTISRITQEHDALVVWYIQREAGPLPAGEVTGTTPPFHIVRLAHSPLAVRFTRMKAPPIVPQP